jgi:nucleoid-associated protein YgaU
MAAAKAAMEKARQADAPKLVPAAYNQAKDKADEAARLFSDPLKYKEAKVAADEAARLAANAAAAAVAEKKRLEEEAKRAEAERLRREAEEARRAEEEMLRRFPPVYTVQRGDSLWKISGMQKIYDNSIFWPIVYDANDAQIDDPDLIYPGQEFSIPRGKSVEEMEVMLLELWVTLSAEADALEE